MASHLRQPAALALLLWICSAAGAVLTAAEPPGTLVLPLPVAGAGDRRAADIDHALIALSAGDTGPLDALADEEFSAPLALPDKDHPELARRWTLALPVAVARLAAPAREHVLSNLDARFASALPAHADEEARARVAARFLPAPAAVRALGVRADRAFDLGRFDEFLGIARLRDLAGGGLGDDQRRDAVAATLSGRGPDVDEGLRLQTPGLPRPTSALPLPGAGGLSVAWTVLPGWVLACDPWGGVLWQFRTERAAQVLTGPGAALVRDSQGVRALDEGGAVRELPALPPGARVWSVAGGAAWFSTGTQAWRLDLIGRGVARLDLAGEPLAAPLVRGDESLWLTAREVALFAHDRPVQRLRHGLPAGAGWCLGADRTHPLVIAPDGQRWRLESLAEQLAAGTPMARARLLLAAGRPEEALVALAGVAKDADSDAMRLRAHLARGSRHAAERADELLALAATPQQRATVHQAVLAGLDAADLGRRATEEQAVAALGDAHGQVLLAGPGATVDWSDDPRGWAHVLTGAGARSARTGPSSTALFARPAHTWSRIAATPTALADAAASGTDGERRQDDGGYAYRGQVVHLASGIARKEVQVHAPDGTLRWWRRWDALSGLQAPGVALVLRDDAVIVLEGQARLTALDLATGATLAQLDLPAGVELPGEITVLGHDHIAVLGPLGLNRRLDLVTAGGYRSIALPSPARWLVAWGGGALVYGEDGVARSFPSGATIALPAPLATVAAPLLSEAGLRSGSLLFPWDK